MSGDALVEIDDYPGLSSPAGAGRLRLARGTLTWLHGESGAGKSRLMRRLIDLDPEPLGTMRFGGNTIGAIPAPELRRRLGYLPQDPIRFQSTGREHVERVRALRGNRHRCLAWADVLALLERLDVAALLDRPMQQYSGGEGRRFALVTLLQLQPAALLLDEPTSGLDERRRTAVETLVSELLARGTAVLWAAHDAHVALQGDVARVERP